MIMRIIKPFENKDDMAVIIAFLLSPTRGYYIRKGRKYGRITFQKLIFKILPEDYEKVVEMENKMLDYLNI